MATATATATAVAATSTLEAVMATEESILLDWNHSPTLQVWDALCSCVDAKHL